jgi:hypothetical protein
MFFKNFNVMMLKIKNIKKYYDIKCIICSDGTWFNFKKQIKCYIYIFKLSWIKWFFLNIRKIIACLQFYFLHF